MSKYIFVVSTGRTATTALADFLDNKAGEAAAFHEPSPSFARRAPGLVTRRHRWNERVYFGMPRRRRRVSRGKRVYVEFNHHLFSALPLIRKTFPEATVIQIVRDGRTTVRSWLNKGRYTQTDDFITPADIPGSGVAIEDWLTWSPVKKNAWTWSLVNGVIDSQAPDYRVYYEDIFDPEKNALANVLNTAAPDAFDPGTLYFPDARSVNSPRKTAYPAFEQWTAQEQRDFWDVAGPRMRALGYAQGDSDSRL